MPNPPATILLRLLLAVALLTLGGTAAARQPAPDPNDPGQRFPLPLVYRVEDPATTDTVENWYFWPLALAKDSPSQTVRSFHPFWSRVENHETGEQRVDILWPFVQWRHRPKTFTAEDRTSLSVWPLWYSTKARRDGKWFFHRSLIPFYWHGGVEGEGQYLVAFPFYWRAQNARVLTPLFPTRPQNFRALWPLAGEFHGWFNRDRIWFVLWPLFVGSEKGEGDDAFKARHFLWPFFTVFSGERVSGFRAWPLVSHVRKEGEFRRTTFLWPLGQVREGRISDIDARTEDTAYFLPFWARIRRPEWEFDLAFPIKGELRTKGRTVRGYALGFYNADDNHRTGLRHNRLGWIFVRWTSRIPVPAEFQKPAGDQALRPPEGGGIFPFYLRYANEKRRSLLVAWPFYNSRWNRYTDHEFDRRFLFPFHAALTKTYDDGRLWKRTFTWPVWRSWTDRDGVRYSSAPHLWWYARSEPVDRVWAPLWTLWEKREDTRTGSELVRVAKGAYVRDTRWYGAETRRTNLLVYRSETMTGPNRPTAKRQVWLFGLLSREQIGEDVDWKWFRR